MSSLKASLPASLLVIVALLLSGCTEGAPSASPSSSTAPVSTVAIYTPVTGGIEGTVTDEELQPIAGATVGIVGNDETVVRTDAVGAFAFSELEPGTYKIAAQAMGFSDAMETTDVVAGNTSTISIVLAAIATVPNTTAADNLLTPTNNVVYLHIINSPRKYWINDTQESGAGETARAGSNGLAWALGAGSAGFTIPLEPALAAPVALDKSKTIDFTLFVGPFFSDNDVGKLTISVTLANGATRVAAGAGKEVTIMPGTIEELKWSVAPEVDALDPMQPLTWAIKADGATVGMSIGAKNNVKSNIVFPVQ